jgi:predicted glutamine amidotransferase
MCRIFAFVTGHDRAVPDLLEPAELASFRSLSRLHGDGWGMAFAIAGENARPFRAGGWAFAHNGMIAQPERMDALLAPMWRRATRQGTTDSERYFLCVLQSINRSGDTIAGVRTAVAAPAGRP